jgi:hypothetical protein
MKTMNIIGASTLAALEANLVMKRSPSVLRRAVRWGSGAVGIACLMITTTAGALAAGETWDAFASGTGVNGPVRAVTTFGGDLIVGGQFGTAGGLPGTLGIARWDDVTGWSALGSGMDSTVMCLTTVGTDLIAGGLFTSASGVPASHIAKWNGTTWSALGAGLNGDVYALTTFNGALYAGGTFTKAGKTTVNYIAKWDGTAWSSVANGMNGNVHALTTFNGALYAGGAFTKVGSTSGFNRIAKWNGSAWSKLGTGVGGISTVFALTSFNGGLIVGGQFAMAGGVAGTPGIARWSGSTWSALGGGLNNTVASLATFDDLSGSGTELYVGGYFTASLGGAAIPAVQIARWNGAWSAVGSGMVVTQPSDSYPRGVFALSPNPSGDHLWAGGNCEVSPQTPGVAGYLMGYHFVP